MNKNNIQLKFNHTKNQSIVTFLRNDEKIGTIKYKIDNNFQTFMFFSWNATKGYGRKILLHLLDKLVSENKRIENYEIMGFIKSPTKNNKRLYNIYSKLKFKINKDGFFSETVKKILSNSSRKRI